MSTNATATEPKGSTKTQSTRTPAKRYAFAAAAVVIAFLARLSLDPLLDSRPNKHVFVSFIVATTVVVWYSGFVPALLTFIAGFMVADYYFLDPQFSIFLPTAAYLEVVLPPMLVCSTILLFGRAMHVAREKADANARRAIDHWKKLEAEVAERMRAEEEVRRLNSELEQRVELRTAELVSSNQELESFTYSVSHDLRAPLRHVDGYAQILEEEFGPQMSAEAQKFLAKIRNGSQNMGRLVDDLLNLSRVGKRELNRRQTALHQVIDEVIAEIKLEAPGRNIEWRVGSLPSVHCDPGLIKQVFINLLSNAVKYTRPRELAVIEIGQTSQGGEPAFFVRDNGVGFNMKYSGKLFGVFQRLHRAEEFEGTGVGLVTVARIVRKHGGRIWAEAELNRGATFFFTLPGLSPAVPEPVERPVRSRQPEAGELASAAPMN